ncbi:SapB/AmfS family lantipeptide [Nocardiopsis deserti]|nr:SapB/AmfS family lantipeptide [Nocardiopsis deserti]
MVLSDVLSLQGMDSVVDESVMLCSGLSATCDCG